MADAAFERIVDLNGKIIPARLFPRLQFQRIGYFMADLDSIPEHLIYNKTVNLKDTWAKMKNKEK